MAWTKLLLSALVGLASALGDTDTITWGGDNSRTGYQTNHNMDPSIVGSSQFGQLFKTTLPGNWVGAKEQIFSQPLVYTPSGGDKQYVYWATTQNNVYKLDAKTGEIVASRRLHIPFLSDDLDGCVDINPTVGIISTGVIDPETDTLYLTSKTYADQNGGEKAQGLLQGRYYVHAIDVNDLSERPNFPFLLDGITAKNNPRRMFQGGTHLQRPALLHYGQYIYAGFASHCVQYNFTGWIIGWDKTTGKIVEHFATEGKDVKETVKGGGVWMSGGGLTSDDAGSIFFASGNGYASQLSNVPVKGFNPPTSLEEAAVHMTVNDDGSLNLVDFFMPWEKQALDGADKDLGTSPLELLPSQFQCGNTKRIGVVTGKSGKTYWLNMDNLGGYRNGADGLDDAIQVYQNENSVYAGAGVYPLEGGYIYINVIQHPTAVFKFSCDNGVASFAKVAESPTDNAYILGVSHGTTTSLNGQPGTGLLWVTDVQGLNLRIYDAIPKNGKLNMINSFNIPGVLKFSRPVFGDGIVYIGTNQGLVYGFGSPVNLPLNCTSPVDFGNVNIKGDESAEKTVSCTALVDVKITDIALDDRTDYDIAGLPTLPATLAKGSTIKLQAKFKPTQVGLLSTDIVFNTTNSVAGYSINTHARLTGTGQSKGPLLGVSRNTVTFQGVVAGADPNGVTEPLTLSNNGNSKLTIKSVLTSLKGTSGPFDTWDGEGDVTFSKFTLQKVPATIDANKGAGVIVKFDSSTTGTYSGYVKFVSDGGNQTVAIAASAGSAPVALLEFQTPDTKDWVKYQPGTPFTFGNVTENTHLSLNFRVTNTAPKGGVKLSLTVSKPPFGVKGIVRANNQVDLAEGTSLGPGENATATLTCTVPKAQWNMEPYNGTAVWTMNTNDPTFDKQVIQFFCNAVTEQAPPLLGNGLGQYRYAGCYQENNPGRQLDNLLFGSDTLKNGDCIQACADKKAVFCGTQYHRECWAGKTIPKLKVDDVNCNFYCSGAINQICGGNNDGKAYISLFADTKQWDGNSTQPPDGGDPPAGPIVNPGVLGYGSIGCYTEAKNGRALPNGKATDKKNVAACVKACSDSGYKLAGLEYGGECWCGDSLTSGAVQAPAKDCSMTCNDNSTEYCGGPSRLNVYKQGNKPVTTTTLPVTTTSPGGTTSVPPTTTSDGSETTTQPPTQTGPAVKDKVGDFAFQGCFTESTTGRALPDKTYADDKMTLESCAKFCKEFNFFGVEYGRECYCGNKLSEGSIKAKDQKDCSFPCPGDKSEYCGAGNRLELYKKSAQSTSSVKPSTSSSGKTTTSKPSSGQATTSSTTSKPTTSQKSTSEPVTTSQSIATSKPTTTTSAAPTGPTVYKGNSNFTYYSCVKEPSAGRLMEDQRLNDGKNMTIELCLKTCSKYNYAGVEYGRECWCGNTLNLDGDQTATPGKNVSDSECNFLCPGNQNYYCGAGSRMSLYILKDLVKKAKAKVGKS